MTTRLYTYCTIFASHKLNMTLCWIRCAHMYTVPSCLKLCASCLYVCYTVGLYSEIGGQLALFSGMAGGVTQLMFSADGNYLFSGCRKVSQNCCLLCLPGKPCCSEQFVNAASHTYGACSNEQWPLLNLRMCVMYLRLLLNVCRSVWCYLLYSTVRGKGNNSVSWLTVFWKSTSLFVNFGG